MTASSADEGASPLPQAEIEDAIDFYNSESPGLGHDFLDETIRTMHRVADNPLAWQNISPRTRRCLLHRFPYAILYELRKEEILVIAVMRLARHPNSWRKRL